jgi:hypothetical protein
MMLDGAEECQFSGPIGEFVPFTFTYISASIFVPAEVLTYVVRRPLD